MIGLFHEDNWCNLDFVLLFRNFCLVVCSLWMRVFNCWWCLRAGIAIIVLFFSWFVRLLWILILFRRFWRITGVLWAFFLFVLLVVVVAAPLCSRRSTRRLPRRSGVSIIWIKFFVRVAEKAKPMLCWISSNSTIPCISTDARILLRRDSALRA